MLFTAQETWRTASSLCRIARRSSPKWSALEYRSRGDGSTWVPAGQIPASKRYNSIKNPPGSRVSEDDNTKASGTVTTSAPQATSIEHLLEQIPQAAERKLPRKGQLRSASLLLLLTPSYAQHALDPDLPLRVLEKLRGSREGSKPLKTVTAVVDRIPDGSGNSEGLVFGYRNRDARLKSTEDGLQPVEYDLQEMAPSAQKPGWLDFFFKTSKTKGISNREHVEVQLPLARTIFSNGLVSTMIHRVYEPDGYGILSQLGKQTSLERFWSDMTPYVEDRMPQLHAPLVPLTPARQIRNIMGNIIRTVSAEPTFNGSGKVAEASQPASEELEQAVTAFFTALDIQPQPVAVWALIIPSPLPLPSTVGASTEGTYRLLGSQDENLHALWTAKNIDNLVDSVLNHLLPTGARLRKVLSGGGGWGKKAGLLSLDPDDRYSTRELRQDTGWEVDINEDLKEQQRQALGQIAEKGESVMFFLAPEGLTGYDNRRIPKDQDDLMAVFGSLTSSIDSVPDLTPTTTDDAKSTVKYRDNFIGALSEEGLALTMTDIDEKVTKTKFDVPFSQVRITRTRHDNASTTGPPKMPNGKREYSTASTSSAASTVKERRKLKER